MNLKELKGLLDMKRISFGSPQRLKKHLGVDPGAVSLLAVYNDSSHLVEVFMDADLWESETFQFHPIVNTSTLVISKTDIESFLSATGHEMKIIDIPG